MKKKTGIVLVTLACQKLYKRRSKNAPPHHNPPPTKPKQQKAERLVANHKKLPLFNGLFKVGGRILCCVVCCDH
jgi:hypothetical protein